MSDTPLTDAMHKDGSDTLSNIPYWQMFGHAKRMERDRAALLECIRETAKWAGKRGYAGLADRLRAAIAKAGASHE